MDLYGNMSYNMCNRVKNMEVGGIVLQLALCDDDNLFSEHLEKLVVEWARREGEKINIKKYNDGSKLLDYICMEGIQFDIILLDMQMKNMNGISTAQAIRKEDKNVIIIFITSYIEMVLHAFEVKAYRYLLKGTIDEEIYPVLTSAVEEIIDEKKNLFVFSFQSTDYQIPLQDIIYFESAKRSINIYLKDKVYTYYGKLNEVEYIVSKQDFIRCHQSFIVNLKYISEIKGYELMLDNHKCIPISKSKAKDVNSAFTWSLR